VTSSVLAYHTAGPTPVYAVDGLVIDSGTVTELQRRIDQALSDGRRLIVIDLLGAGVMSASVLSMLCAALRQACSGGPRLAIVGADPRVAGIFELCEIDGLELHPTINTALASSMTQPSEPPRLGWRGLLTRLRAAPQSSEARTVQ
jgi:anti-anti-sigma factor